MFQTNYYIGRKTFRRIYVVRGEIDEKTAYIQGQMIYGQSSGNHGKARQAEGEAKVVWGKDSSWKRAKIARDLCLWPEDKEFKETIKTVRKKLETPVALAMPCKIMKNCGKGVANKNKTKLACILEANESTRMRMGNSIPSNHEDHMQEKVRIHCSIITWFTNLFLCIKL